jgi:hypothetical protein
MSQLHANRLRLVLIVSTTFAFVTYANSWAADDKRDLFIASNPQPKKLPTLGDREL